MKGRAAGVGVCKPALSAAIAADLEAWPPDSVATDLGKSFPIIVGGVDKFLALWFSKVEAKALNAGDRPLTRTLSALTDTLLERCDFSGAPDLPPMTGTLLLGLYQMANTSIIHKFLRHYEHR